MGRLLFAAALVLAPSLASAHVRVDSPAPRDPANIKSRHCGVTGSTRANVHTALPGSTLHLAWTETINHPGYYRVSFNPDGDTFRIPAPAAGGGFPTEDLTGMLDPGGSGSTIVADRILDGTTSYDFVLPTTECLNCTIQVIQLMTDKPPYTIDTASNDIYFQCVDLIVSNSAPPIDAPTGNPGDPDAGTSGEPGVTSGGCSTGGASSGGLALALAGLGVAFARRRTRR